MIDNWQNLRHHNHKHRHQRLVIVGDATIAVVGIRSTIVANDLTLTAFVIIVAVWSRSGCVKASPCPLARRCCIAAKLTFIILLRDIAAIVAAAALLAAVAIATYNIHRKSAIIRIAPLAWMGTLVANASVGHTLRH